MKIWQVMMLALLAAGAGCGGHSPDPAAEAPPPLRVVNVHPTDVFSVEHPEQFPLVAADARESAATLDVTGTVAPDVSRNVPVVSLATGRVLEVDARLGDTVTKGQLLLRVQSTDVSDAYSGYRKAVANEQLTRTQLERSQLLYDKGAISLNDLQVAQAAETDAQVDVQADADHLRVLGSPNLDQPTEVIDIRAPIAGVITDQEVTAAAGVQGLASPNPFTISDLSHVWILCDVYENDLAAVRLGERADIRLDAYPGHVFSGTIANIGPILDPNIRTAKVRIEMENPGLMRPGMFVTATFHGQDQRYAVVPADAIVHLHDRDWVYVPAGGSSFRRVEVVSGDMLPGHRQEVVSGLMPGQRVVANALEFESTVAQ